MWNEGKPLCDIIKMKVIPVRRICSRKLVVTKLVEHLADERTLLLKYAIIKAVDQRVLIPGNSINNYVLTS